MRKLLTGLAAAAALLSFVSFGQACDFHAQHVTASVAQTNEAVAMSTYDGPSPLPTLVEASAQAALPECPAGEKDCVPASE